MARVLAAIALGALLGVAPAAQAAGPKPVGGDGREILYKQNLGHGRYFELRALPNGQVTWLEVYAKWTCPVQHYVRMKPFLADGKPHIDSSRRVRATDSYDKGRWTLRFSADWSKVSGSFNARLSDCRTGTFRVSGRRARPVRSYAFGHYTGTTSQGLPVSFDATYAVRYGSIEYLLRHVVATARFSCDDGTIAEKTLLSDMEGLVSSTKTGSLYASLNETGKLSGSLDEISASLQGVLQGSTATGTLEAGSYKKSDEVSCEVPEPSVTFSVTRA
jgi:hypothetical protein